MEMNYDCEEKFNLIEWSSSRDHGLGDHHQAAKSYTCNFCKRGFSNAQALGGHINIHRRDRARFIGRLMSSKDKDDDPNQVTVVDHDSVRANYSSKEEEEEITSCHSATRVEDHEEAQAQFLQIPLFLEEPIVSSENSNQEGHYANEGGKLEELDLELRLGPGQPPESNSRTRELF